MKTNRNQTLFTMAVLLLLLLPVAIILGCSSDDDDSETNSTSSTSSSSSGPIGIPGPTNLIVEEGNGELILHWASVSNAASYELRYKEEDDEEYGDAIEVADPNQPEEEEGDEEEAEGEGDAAEEAGEEEAEEGDEEDERIEMVSHTITNLENGTNYEIQILWVDSNGGGSLWSDALIGAPSSHPAMQNLAVAVEDSAMQVSWNVVRWPGRGNIYYEVRYRRADAAEFTTITNGDGLTIDGTSYFVDGLENGIEYVVQMRVDLPGSDEFGPWSAPITATPVAATSEALPAPTNFRVTFAFASDDRTLANLSLFWGELEGASRYEFRYKESDDPGSFTNVTANHSDEPILWRVGTEELMRLNDLTTGTEYTFQLRGVRDDGGKGIWTEPFMVRPYHLARPENLVALPRNAEIHLSWDEVTNSLIYATAAKYGVRYKVSDDTGDYTNLPAQGDADITATSYIIMGLVNDTEYRVQVRALNRYDQGSSWSWEQRTTPVAVATPEGVFALGENNQLRVIWNEAVGAVKYQVRHKVSTAADSTYVVLPASGSPDITATSHVIASLANGTTYTVQVRAVSSDDENSPWSLSASGMPSDLPAPTNLVVEEEGHQQLTLSWDAVAAATKYHFRYKEEGQAEDQSTLLLRNPNPDDPPDYTGSRWVFPRGTFSNGTNYVIQMRIVDASDNEGPWSEPVMGRPYDKRAPENVMATVGDDQLGVSWDLRSGADRYEIRHKETGMADTTYMTNTNDGERNTNAIITGLTNGTNYTIQVRSVTAYDQEGDWSPDDERRRVTATPVDLAAPEGVAAVVGNALIILSWDLVDSATKYELRYRLSPAGSAYTDIVRNGREDIANSPFTIESLNNDSAYVVEVKALNALDQSSPWSSVTATPSASPSAPLIALKTNTGLSTDAFTSDATIRITSGPGATVTLSLQTNGTAHTFAASETNEFDGPTGGGTFEVNLLTAAPSIAVTGSATNAIQVTATASWGGPSSPNSPASSPVTFTLVAAVTTADANSVTIALENDTGNDSDKITTDADVVISTIPDAATVDFEVETNGSSHSQSVSLTADATNNFGLSVPTTGSLSVSITPTISRHGHSAEGDAFEYTLFAWSPSLTVTYTDDGDGLLMEPVITVGGLSAYDAADIKIAGFVITNTSDSSTNVVDIPSRERRRVDSDFTFDLRHANNPLGDNERIHSITIAHDNGHSVSHTFTTALRYEFEVPAYVRHFQITWNCNGIAITSNNILLIVAGSGGGNQIQFYTTNGGRTNINIGGVEEDAANHFGGGGSGPGSFNGSGNGDDEFNNPRKIAIDDDGKIYISDEANNRVQIFDDEFTYETNITNLALPREVMIHDGYLHVASNSGRDLSTFAVDGLAGGSRLSRTSHIHGVAVDSNGTYHIVREGNDNVQAITGSPTTGFSYSRGHDHTIRPIGGDSGSSQPGDIVIGPTTGWLYVSDGQRDQVLVFEYDSNAENYRYTLLGIIGGELGGGAPTPSDQSPNGQLDGPWGMAIHGGMLYVVERSGRRVQVFNVPE